MGEIQVANFTKAEYYYKSVLISFLFKEKKKPTNHHHHILIPITRIFTFKDPLQNPTAAQLSPSISLDV